ncbi:serine/threonine-protein kinase [Calycomorphotria hydatis]|uniref:Serine/threonine-protein kinase PrkC n=1 Tax=Calycomorphotria hydatis TaxID=2528027 RepID=A0A517T797_9PLAN|nr:serine/threonine-protein kinase [Calycomorphotria hydatis]QDT64248.1 Serine/threonine-protein kinase PrkC [Calycomorphotria hydatis]
MKLTLSNLLGFGPRRLNVSKRFNLIGEVGQGSMSKVWMAQDFELGCKVALKLLDREKTSKFESRFSGLQKPSEGEVAVSLNHPNIVKTHEQGLTTDNLSFLIMEYIEGHSLAYHVGQVAEKPIHARLDWVQQIGSALAHMHDAGWIHRDICPRNIMVSNKSQTKLIDFGLAIPDRPEFRRPGNRTGTANYLAPEVIRRQPTDQRVDVFAYSITCYEICTGELPWERARSLDAAIQHLNLPAKPLLQYVPDFPIPVADVIMRGIATNPDERWNSMEDMNAAMRDAIDCSP